MKRALLTLTAALLCAGTALAQNSATGSAVAAQPSATKQPAAAEIKPFGIGDKAPEFKVAKFVKGEPITGFEKGKTYVVEFWATWCGPCKESIPHLTKLAAEYKGKVTFVGVSVWEADQDRVGPFVTEWDKKMEYNVAMDDVPAYPEGVKAGTRQAQQHAFQNGTMSRTWMQGGGRDGIPSAFIVNGDGRIAWIGDPRAMDDVLSQVVAGKWDVEKAAAAGKAMSAFGAAMEAEDYDKAYDAVRGQIDVLDAMSLNDIAWTIVDPSGNVEKKDLDLALKAASRANELSGNKDGAILDTLARVYFLKGDLKKAVDTETRAIENSPDALKAQLEPVLKEYKDALAKKPG